MRGSREWLPYFQFMLHITNGDSVAGTLREAGFGPDIIAWRDVLHEGPVPADLPLAELSSLRARFIVDSGWGVSAEVSAQFAERDRALPGAADHDEAVLWFEHDLYDQLQLLQVLDWFAAQGLDGTRLSLICNAEHLGRLTADELRTRFPDRRPVSGQQLNVGRDAWSAFRSPDPRSLLPFLGDRSSPLRFLGAAIRRHLQQFPDALTGLSRSESQALAAIEAGHRQAKQAYFASHHQEEDAVFLGDTIFATYIAGMSQESSPLVLRQDGDRIVAPGDGADSADFWNSDLAVTNAGSAVRGGVEDRVLVNGIDRWLGGVHLQPGNVWRWHEAKSVVARSD
jgi:hypothetical protein